MIHNSSVGLERLTVNQNVVGSSPTCDVPNLILQLLYYGFVIFPKKIRKTNNIGNV